jgi:hypothetical protein
LDDEDMARMDEALSNIFRSICKKKPAGVRKKEMRDALAIMHFKIRALDMVINILLVLIVRLKLT